MSTPTVEEAVVDGVVTFPYVPGLLAFREVPTLATVLGRLAVTPDLLLCDGQGIAHPRRGPGGTGVPDPIRLADRLSRRALRAGRGVTSRRTGGPPRRRARGG